MASYEMFVFWEGKLFASKQLRSFRVSWGLWGEGVSAEDQVLQGQGVVMNHLYLPYRYRLNTVLHFNTQHTKPLTSTALF